MDKILVPVDLSSASDWGFYYAYQLAQDVNAEIIVVHLYEPQPINVSVIPNRKKDILAGQRDVLIKALRSSTQPPLNTPESERVPVKYILESRDERSIAKIAEDHTVNLVVMGTHGADGAWDRLFGTNTSKVIKEANCPVLAIPAGVEYEKIERVAYGTDYSRHDIEYIKRLVSFAGMVDAEVHCIHVSVLSSKQQTEERKVFLQDFEDAFDGLDMVNFTERASNSVHEGLETYLRINEISILGMLTQKRTIWRDLFGISTTREIALDTKIPLLAFHA